MRRMTRRFQLVRGLRKVHIDLLKGKENLMDYEFLLSQCLNFFAG